MIDIEEFFQESTTKDDLKYILKSSFSHEHKDRAAHQLLSKQPTKSDLCLIIEYATPHWGNTAFSYLLKQKPNGEELCFVLKHGTEYSRIKVSMIIFEQFAHSDYLVRVIEFAPFQMKLEAVKKLLEKEEPSNDELQKIISLGQPFNNAAVEKALSLVPSNDLLRTIIRYGNEKQEERARAILDKRFSKKNTY